MNCDVNLFVCLVSRVQAAAAAGPAAVQAAAAAGPAAAGHKKTTSQRTRAKHVTPSTPATMGLEFSSSEEAKQVSVARICCDSL